MHPSTPQPQPSLHLRTANVEEDKEPDSVASVLVYIYATWGKLINYSSRSGLVNLLVVVDKKMKAAGFTQERDFPYFKQLCCC